MKTFGNADGGKVSVALVGKNEPVGKTALDGRCHGRTASVKRFDHVHVKVIVGQHGASGRRNADRDAPNAHLVNHFSDQPVDDAVPAAGTVMKNIFFQALGMLENDLGHG